MRLSISSASVTVFRWGSLDSSAAGWAGLLLRHKAWHKECRRHAPGRTCHKAHAARILVIFRIKQALGLRDGRVLAHHLH